MQAQTTFATLVLNPAASQTGPVNYFDAGRD